MNVQSPKNSSLSDFQILQELGKGSFSTVYRVRRIQDSQEYALKKVRLGSLKEKEKKNALNEVRLLASINSKYIVAYKEAFLDDQSHCLCIVMELLSGGDVQKRINSALKGGPPFTETEIWRAFTHMTMGLKTLHDQRVVHRDLKSANIFLATDGTFKLGDLNVSIVAKQGLVYTQTGTPYYASPEVWRDEPYDMKSDIWSLGCVLYEMACLKTPFRATDMDQLYRKVQRGLYDQIPAKYSKELQQLISLLLQVRPSERPSCEQLLKNPLVQKHLPQQQTETQQSQLLKTIQLPRNEHQLRSQLPKSKYENDNMTKSVERINERSTEHSTSPFRSPQTKLESKVSQSQVIQNRGTNDALIRNYSAINNQQKHQLLLHNPKEVTKQERPSQKQERPSSTRPIKQEVAKTSVSPNRQKSFSPINQKKSVLQQAPSNPVIQQNPRYNNNNINNNIVRPYVSQSTSNPSLKPQSAVPPQNPSIIRQSYDQPVRVCPQSAVPKYSNNYQSRTPKEPQYVHPQSAAPHEMRSERPQVFPMQAKVTNKPKTQPTENYSQNKKQQEYGLVRPAGKPTRPLSNNVYNDRIVKQEYAPQYNLITGNYNHYYPIENYQRHASDQNLIRYQMRQAEYGRQIRQQRKF